VAFWSSQTLGDRLGDLIEPARPETIDCNAVTLHVGREVYVTPSLELTAPGTHTKTQLAEGAPFAIPAGQFAFLLTEEIVRVPVDAMAFISMKARVKFRGLVNVSGFHVDPGWTGPLIFAVFNAGPSTVHLQRGMPLFLIWFADLDAASIKGKTSPGPSVIPPDLINNITGELNSFQSLDKKMREEDRKLSDRIHSVEKTQARILATATVLGALLLGVLGYTLRGVVSDWLPPRPQVQMAPSPPPLPSR